MKVLRVQSQNLSLHYGEHIYVSSKDETNSSKVKDAAFSTEIACRNAMPDIEDFVDPSLPIYINVYTDKCVLSTIFRVVGFGEVEKEVRQTMTKGVQNE